MRERETLLSTLPEEVRDDAERLIGATEADPHEVVAELHRRGLLKDDQVRDAVLALEGALRVGRMKTKPPVGAGIPSILGPLGAGAMGEVLLAKDSGLNRVVAIKRLHPDLAARKTVLERFYKEAQITAQLDHPAIVPIHGLVQTEDGGLAYAMKLVRGRTMEHYLDEAREGWAKRSAEDAEHTLQARLEVFLHVCDALAYAHEKGVLHRDLKPENIMVGTFGQVMVMDWGLAKVLDQPEAPISDADGVSPKKTHGTRVGAVMGTPRYMSPEQSEGRVDIMDARSDQYALGLVLFETVTLRPAVSPELDLEGCLTWAKNARKQAMNHAYGGRVPRELVAVVDKATAKDPKHRYKNVAELGADVRRYLRDESVAAKPDSLMQKVVRWVGRHRSLMLSMLLASLLALVVVSTGLMAFGLATIEWRRRAAAGREARITAFLGEVGKSARQVEEVARDVESLATGLSFAAEASLDRPESDLGLHYDPLEGPPPKTRKSDFYGVEVSAERPSFGIAEGVDAGSVRVDVERLAVLGHEFGRVLVDAAGQGGDQKIGRNKRLEVVTKQGSPIVWAHIATERGVLATFPGLDAGPKVVADPRKAPWFASARSGMAWSSAAVDPAGQGVVTTVSLPVWRQQELLGVASVDVSLDAFGDRLVLPTGAKEVFLVDGRGRKVVWPKMGAHGLKKFEPVQADPGLLAAMKIDPDGWQERDGEVLAWTPIPSLGWTWVAIADASVVH